MMSCAFRTGPRGRTGSPTDTDATVRVLMLSTMIEPSAAVYPDSDKIGVWPGNKEDTIMVRRESNVEYWDGET